MRASAPDAPLRMSSPCEDLRFKGQVVRQDDPACLGWERTSPVSSELTYLIATTPAAGTGYLGRVLTATNLAGRPKEYFKPRIGRWHKEWGVRPDIATYRPYVDAALRNTTSPNGVFGATLHWEHFAWLCRTLRADGAFEEEDPVRLMDLVFSRPKYIRLRRRDTSRQAIEYYESIHSGKPPWSSTDRTETPSPSTTDLVYVRWLEELLIDHDRQWSRYFEHQGIEPLELYFEDLLDDWRRVVRRVLAFLGLERPPGGIRPVGRRPRADLGWSATWSTLYGEQRRLLPERAPGPAWVSLDRLEYRPHPPVPPLTKVEITRDELVLFSCVTDRAPKLRYQTLVWCLTLIELAGRSPDQLVVHAVEGTSREHLKEVRDLGVKVVTVERYDQRSPYANKFRQLDSPALHGADRVVLCDCDLAFCGDVSAEIQGDDIGAKVVDAGFPGYETWVKLADLAGVKGPLEPRRSTLTRRWTYANNINFGFVVIPRDWLAPLAEAWPRWYAWIMEHGHAFDASVARYPCQVAFGLAALEVDLPVRQLSPVLNFSTLPPYDDGGLEGTDPLVLHYHHRLNPAGLLKPTGRPGTDRAIATVNALLSRPEPRKMTAAARREWRESQLTIEQVPQSR